ncbi:vacuole membrane protein KMS1 isoform X2 [Magnolia sinica]|uniref:vacuole membrane protein KMS1 isoform X2 n=1 Tax=Magnolia sinica TaxID=86752 RepID=UPI002659E118|nr:vacuole membrane protein KMS1 isoform X2 [Magnolia sinica]
MESGKSAASPSLMSVAESEDTVGDVLISELRERHQLDLENLTLTTQPFKTLKLFTLAIVQYLKQSILYVLTRGGWLMLFCTVAVASGLLLIAVDGPHEKHVQEFIRYFRFILWWVALGVASSIGLGSGLHTFVLYLGPHIALFTIKAMQCGRVDLKTTPYDTIQLKKGPSWLEKDCSEYGLPMFPSLPDSLVRVPLSSILPQVQLEAILWGFGTALGELPPYFISRAAYMSGSKLDTMEELDASSKEDGVIIGRLKQIKRWLFDHSKHNSQHLNFFTILILASVPNPLFDLAGIMCGQFGIPFWEFFLATLIGKAIIKTHIQTVFIISVCNNQLLEWIENELIWVLGLIPGLPSVLPNLIAKLIKMKEKYLTAPVAAPSNVKRMVTVHIQSKGAKLSKG